MDYLKQLQQLRSQLFSDPVEEAPKKKSFVSPRSINFQTSETEDPLARIKGLLRKAKDVSQHYKESANTTSGFSKGFEAATQEAAASREARKPSLIPRPVSEGDTVEDRRGSLPSITAPRDSIDNTTSGSAVDQFVNQIIQVESGGKANAKNPLSSATGLGQFISSTWMNMITKYRPDVMKGKSREEILALRNDADLSREMTKRYTQENESYLSSKGHNITPGRLYLAHFLGPGGANTVLSANGSSTVADVMGQGVIKANPFLANYTINDLTAWADRKMRTR